MTHTIYYKNVAQWLQFTEI